MVVESHKKVALDFIDYNREQLVEISDTIWRLAEVGMQEVESSRVLADFLEENDFIVERGVADMPTAFVGTYGKGKPVIGFEAEFDALPELSNKVVPQRDPLVEGGPGHGCGHNAFGTGCVGAAIGVKEAIVKKGVQGTVKLFGTPAEEMCIGKPFMVRAGIFDDVDAVMYWHPGGKTEVRGLNSTNAYDSVAFSFHGYSSHGSSPWKGNDALAAAEVMDSTINIIRGYVEPGTTINRTVLDATQFANVLSDHAKVWYVFRNSSREYLTRLREWIIEAGNAAAKVMNCEVDVDFITGVWPTLINESLAQVIQHNMEMVGPPEFTEEEKAFAKKLQSTIPKRIVPSGGFNFSLDETIKPMAIPKGLPTSTTDSADVSWNAPLGKFSVSTIPVGCPGHSWQSVASHGSSIAHKGLVVAAKILASSAIDLLTKPDLITKIQKEYNERKGDSEYIPAIPKNAKPLLNMHTKYQNEYRRALDTL